MDNIAKALGVTRHAIENFSEEKAINFFNSVYDNDFSHSQGATFGNNLGTFNPIDKIVELYEEKEKLYERLVQSEKDKVDYLEQLLNKK